MEQLRITPKNRYVIEVNDNGDTIEFDIDDIELPFKLERAYQKSKEAYQNLRADILLIEKREDVTEKGELMSRNQRDKINAYLQYYKISREAFDGFLGVGGCQKIFGDQNRFGMFDELVEELQPHFAKMKLSADELGKKIQKKYGSEADGSVIS